MLRPPLVHCDSASPPKMCMLPNDNIIFIHSSAGPFRTLDMGLKFSTQSSSVGGHRILNQTKRLDKHTTLSFFGRGVQERVLQQEAPMSETIPFKVFPGQASPLGVSEVDNGINFAIFSQHATSITLCLQLPERGAPKGLGDGMIELALDPHTNKTGDTWHIFIEDLPRSSVLYGYRIDGPQNWNEGHRFDKSIVLLDPYAKLVEGRRVFGDVSHRLSRFLGTYDFASLPFDWGDDYKLPDIPEKDLVIYEMNVRALTADKSSELDPKIRGSYLGVIEKIAHLVELGVNAVELLPVFEFDEFEFQRRPNPRDHMNFWATGFVFFGLFLSALMSAL